MNDFERKPLTPEEKIEQRHVAHDFAVDWVGKGNPNPRDHDTAIAFIDTAVEWVLEQDFKIRDNPKALGELGERLLPILGEDRRQLERKANSDPLTGLANKEVFAAARQTAEEDPYTSFLFFDARSFEDVNNELGHDAGDEEIKKIAHHIRDEADKHGLGTRVFRVGGDEFAVITPSDLARYLHHNIIEHYGEHVYARNVKTSLRGVCAETFTEAAQKMVDLKKQEKIGKLGKLAIQVKSLFAAPR